MDTSNETPLVRRRKYENEQSTDRVDGKFSSSLYTLHTLP